MAVCLPMFSFIIVRSKTGLPPLVYECDSCLDTSCVGAKQNGGDDGSATTPLGSSLTIDSAWLTTIAAVIAACNEPNLHIRGRACVLLTG